MSAQRCEQKGRKRCTAGREQIGQRRRTPSLRGSGTTRRSSSSGSSSSGSESSFMAVKLARPPGRRPRGRPPRRRRGRRSEEHTSELQSLMRISYAVFCLKKQKQKKREHH